MVSVQENGKLLEHVQKLVKQGKFLELSKLEHNDATWKSFIYNLPKGTMKWLLNSSIDTLPTKVNSGVRLLVINVSVVRGKP